MYKIEGRVGPGTIRLLLTIKVNFFVFLSINLLKCSETVILKIFINDVMSLISWWLVLMDRCCFQLPLWLDGSNSVVVILFSLIRANFYIPSRIIRHLVYRHSLICFFSNPDYIICVLLDVHLIIFNKITSLLKFSCLHINFCVILERSLCSLNWINLNYCVNSYLIIYFTINLIDCENFNVNFIKWLSIDGW